MSNDVTFLTYKDIAYYIRGAVHEFMRIACTDMCDRNVGEALLFADHAANIAKLARIGRGVDFYFDPDPEPINPEVLKKLQDICYWNEGSWWADKLYQLLTEGHVDSKPISDMEEEFRHWWESLEEDDEGEV